MMKAINTKLEGVIILEPEVYGDSRGTFFESYNQKIFNERIGDTFFVQDNESCSERGVLRGLHFQKPPFDQAKLVSCTFGEVLDVVVDLRTSSPTCCEHLTIRLSGENKRRLFVPRGFAHGFVVLSERAIFTYKVDNWYNPEFDCGIRWNDPELGIDWILDNKSIKLSGKDKNLQSLCDVGSPF